jgi:hypothetical protein
MLGRNEGYGMAPGPPAFQGMPTFGQRGEQLGVPLVLNAKQLTAAIKNATTPDRLAQLAEVHSA